MNPVDLVISPVIWEALVILLLPLAAGSIISLLSGSRKAWGGHVFSFFLALSVALSAHILFLNWSGEELYVTIPWMTLGEKVFFSAGVLLTRETAVMLLIVSVISFMVGVYSIIYMRGDTDFKKYFAHLGLFVFSMNGIVLSSNLLILFVFWELVGLSSYLLINHWHARREANLAAGKAFIVNRIGDAAFLLGIAILWAQFQTLELPVLYTEMENSSITGDLWVSGANNLPVIFLSLSGLCLFLGAAGKSAQFPFQAWLPDAMAGPTPVSALIHAATMVAAGVFLLARVFPLLTIDAMTLMAVIGAMTAFMGAVAALTQYDIKKVLAYSTVSQLGYMIMGMGVGAYDAAMFHLFTHAFFKAGLFLAAGSVIHGMHHLSRQTGQHFDTQDMRRMGGLRKFMPVTFWSFVVLALALAGIPFFSGFLSKEAIMSGLFAWAEARSGDVFSAYHFIPYAAMVTVALTAYYMARQVYLVFLGELRTNSENSSSLEAPFLMRVMTVTLAVFSFGLIWSFNPFSLYESWFFKQLAVPPILSPGYPIGLQPLLVDLSRKNHTLVSVLSSGMIIAGFLLAWYRYRQPSALKQVTQGWFARLSYNNWWLDILYQKGVVVPVIYLSRSTSFIDKKVIDVFINKLAVAGVIGAKITGWADRAIVDGAVHLVAAMSRLTGDVLRSVQGGNVQRYIAAAVIFTILLLWLII